MDLLSCLLVQELLQLPFQIDIAYFLLVLLDQHQEKLYRLHLMHTQQGNLIDHHQRLAR